MPAVAAAGCGSAAGSLAAAITTPLDVAKTRIMIGTVYSQPSVFCCTSSYFSSFF